MDFKSDNVKLDELDLYEILGITTDSTIPEVKKAYRKKALECHPDKNPNNVNAAKQFHRLSEILAILTDEKARRAYDNVLKARKQAEIRHQQFDTQRKRFKDDLERRERQFSTAQRTDEQILKAEIERLRKETSNLIKEELEKLQKEVQQQQQNSLGSYKLKLKWDAKNTAQQYSEENLHKFLAKYGKVVALVVSQKKNGTGLVEYDSKRAAIMAVDMERGLIGNPLHLEWLNQPKDVRTTSSSGGLVKDSDYESVIMMKMRQAEERKRLCEEMQKQDGDATCSFKDG